MEEGGVVPASGLQERRRDRAPEADLLLVHEGPPAGQLGEQEDICTLDL